MTSVTPEMFADGEKIAREALKGRASLRHPLLLLTPKHRYRYSDASKRFDAEAPCSSGVHHSLRSLRSES